MSNFLDIHTPFRRGHDRHFLRGTIGQHGKVILFFNVRTFFDQQASYFLTFGTGLMGNKLHTKNLAGVLTHFIKRFGNFDSATFTTTTRMNLCFDNPYFGTAGLRKLFSGLHCIVHRETGDATGHRHTKLLQEFLTLIFMNFHASSLSL